MRASLGRLLSERAWLFLLSLGIAVTLWYYVGRVPNPETDRTPLGSVVVHNVEVTFAGLADGWIADATPATVDVEVRGPTPAILNVRRSEVQAIADVDRLEPGPHQVNLRIRIPTGVTSVQVIPPTVRVALSRR